LELHWWLALDLFVQRGERRKAVDGGAHGAQGIVTVDRAAEDGHHCVADERLDAASAALDRCTQGREVAIEQPQELLRVQTPRKCLRVDQIGEKYRHPLAALVPRSSPGATVKRGVLVKDCQLKLPQRVLGSIPSSSTSVRRACW